MSFDSKLCLYCFPSTQIFFFFFEPPDPDALYLFFNESERNVHFKINSIKMILQEITADIATNGICDDLFSEL